jgi:ankyrin repeat protein
MEDIHSYTPLLTAAEYGQVEGFKLLLDEGAMLVDMSKEPPVVVKSKDRKTALFLAAEHNHPKIMEVHEIENSDSIVHVYFCV